MTVQAEAQERFTVGGYGEVALTRNYYNDNVYRSGAVTGPGILRRRGLS